MGELLDPSRMHPLNLEDVFKLGELRSILGEASDVEYVNLS